MKYLILLPTLLLLAGCLSVRSDPSATQSCPLQFGMIQCFYQDSNVPIWVNVTDTPFVLLAAPFMALGNLMELWADHDRAGQVISNGYHAGLVVVETPVLLIMILLLHISGSGEI